MNGPTSDEYSYKSLKNLCGVSIAHYNVRSLLPKHDDISTIMKESDIDILCLTETHLHDGILSEEIHIPNYACHRFDRTAQSNRSKGGGIVVYHKSARTLHHINLNQHCPPNVELVWFKMSLPRAHDTFICCVYRPPTGNIDNVINIVSQQLEDTGFCQRDDLIILGDINIDLMTENASKKKITDFMRQNNLTQLINSATRVTTQSATLIDH